MATHSGAAPLGISSRSLYSRIVSPATSLNGPELTLSIGDGANSTWPFNSNSYSNYSDGEGGVRRNVLQNRQRAEVL
ncbi:MAG UNVERIFIED_CONTAM: hypothetical protein LVR18_43930 [Planctomycetaceae bacterium]